MTGPSLDVRAAPVPAPHDPVTSVATARSGRSLGWRSLTAIIAGGVLLLALTFGGGMATAWGLGLAGGPGTAQSGMTPPDGTRPGFGDGGASQDGTGPGQRPSQRDEDSEETAPNS